MNGAVGRICKAIPPHKGQTVTSAEKTGCFVDRPGEIAGEVVLVRYWYGIGQEVGHPSPWYWTLD